jgi:hypothetical protein
MKTALIAGHPTFAYAQRLLTAAVVLLACQQASMASDLLNTGGFEGYGLGPLQGQSSWNTIGSGGGTATVASSDGVGGSRGVRVDRGARSDDWWAVSHSGQGLPTARYVLVDWDMKVNSTGAGDTVFGPFVGVDAYDDSFYPQLLGALGVDATTRDVLYQAADSGDLTETGLMVDEGWHHFQIRLDFLRAQYSIAVDNASVAGQPIAFVDGLSSSFSDADIAAFAAGNDRASQRQTATAYLDNFLVREAFPGDYNIDGVVDAADYTVWRDNLESATHSLSADGDGDGNVDQDDYLVWRTNYGATFAPASPVSAPAPEPSAVLLAASAALLACRRRATCGLTTSR